VLNGPLQPWEWALWRELQIARGPDALLDSVQWFTPRWERPNHLRKLAEAVAPAWKRPVRVLSSVPPQHGKSEGIFAWLILFMLMFPQRRNAYITYAADFAETQARRILDIAKTSGLSIRKDGMHLTNWQTEQGGSLLVTSLDGQITGRPLDGIVVVDDAHKNRESSESAVERNKVINGFRGDIMDRLHPGTSLWVNGTRWHKYDLIGTMSNEPGWTLVNLPAITADGKALWPSRRPLDFLIERKNTIGSYEWASKYLGAPYLSGNRVFNEPTRYEKARVYDSVLCIGVDPAATAKTHADASAIVVGAMQMIDGLPHMDILDARLLQVEMPTLARELVAMCKRWNCKMAVESVGVGKPLPSMLRDIAPELKNRIVEITPTKDKFTRAQPLAAAWNLGHIRVPVNQPWVGQYVSSMCDFTGVGDIHDDATDATVHLFDTLFDEMRKRPRGEAADRLSHALPFGS
jgi:predicted phage terminase large subunit-like protein